MSAGAIIMGIVGFIILFGGVYFGVSKIKNEDTNRE